MKCEEWVLLVAKGGVWIGSRRQHMNMLCILIPLGSPMANINASGARR